ncbi:hypothetical protein [Peribacillus simplex]|uniref:hypothetical protein n=1 Tax=Peribacillus simplex TaxID=1478 RepID=UPI001627ADE9
MNKRWAIGINADIHTPMPVTSNIDGEYEYEGLVNFTLAMLETGEGILLTHQN